LEPPPPPTDAKFSVFGVAHDLAAPPPSLANDADSELLYTDSAAVRLNPQRSLTALARSQLTTFLALIGRLSHDAEGHEVYTQDLAAITANMHDLINGYRPHQARETVILHMEEHIDQMRDDIRRIRDVGLRVRALLGQLTTDAAPPPETTANSHQEASAKQRTVNRQMAAWAALN
ncbi:hypothetical protein K470DRAFT_194383, partial [Piedraia hortae CBS 480.64]